MTGTKHSVRAVQCDYKASDDAVYEALRRATADLDAAWDKLRQARRIALKFNQDNPPEQVVFFEGQRQQLVADSVVRATLRLLREKTDAELVCADISLYAIYFGRDIRETTLITPILNEFDVPFIDGASGPCRIVQAPGGGLMFRQYGMMRDVLEADAVVSVAKAKNHYFAGVTGCLKNLFGLSPTEPVGRPRAYFHHFVRLPYVLADIAGILKPALNIVDALVAQAGWEWGDGKETARIMNALIAGDNVVATDACMMHLMGHDPRADWPAPPFHRDRNPILIAAESGLGTVDIEDIDFQSETAPQAKGVFYADLTDPPETNLSWRRTTCQQALYYRDNPRQFAEYAGEYILLQDGEVKWHKSGGAIDQSRRELSAANPDHAMWYKLVDPQETEGERYEVYEQALADIMERQ